MEERYYKSDYTGKEIDDSIGRIVHGEIDELAKRAETAAKSAEKYSENSNEYAEKAKTASLHYPYIGPNKNWMEWDVERSEFVDTGNPSKGMDGIVMGPGIVNFRIREDGHLIVTVDDGT